MDPIKRLHSWQNTAISCGLEVVEKDPEQPRLEALAGLLRVLIEPCGDKGQFTRVVIGAPGQPDFVAVKIRPELFIPSAEEIEIGDEVFDRTFIIQGPKGIMLALLDAGTRLLLLRLRTDIRLEICLGELRAESNSDGRILALLPLLLDAGRRFAQPPPGVPRRLAENICQDPEPRVRLQNLLFLIREHSEEPGTAETLRTACSDRSPEIRLQAARELGSEGRGVLLEIAENVAEDALSAEALSALGAEVPFERAAAILDRARGDRRLQTCRACLEPLGRGGGAAAVAPLAQVLAQEEGDLAIAAVQALAATGSPDAETPLILALQREEEDLRMAAANALGRAGSAAAVLPLKEMAERSWLDRDLRRTAYEAIAEIQSRLLGASPGQLSLAGSEAGQLSLAEAEAGQLSIATDPAGELSLGGTEETTEEA